jgi:hypothetical protein
MGRRRDGLPEDLRRDPEAGQPQPDEVEYAIRADGHTVRALVDAQLGAAQASVSVSVVVVPGR